jgi:hypothetical protein
MSLIPDPTSPGDKPHHQLTETALEGHLGGPSYAYRGVRIDCMKGGCACCLTLDSHPLAGMNFSVAGTGCLAICAPAPNLGDDHL